MQTARAKRAHAGSTPPEYADDCQLVAACLNNDEKAWRTFLGKYRKICAIIARQYDAAHELDDLFSSFILKLVGTSQQGGALARYDATTSLNTFLSVVFRHLVFDYHRDRKRKFQPVLSPRAIDDCPDHRFDPARQHDDENCEETDSGLLQAVKSLSKEEQYLVELHYYNEFSLRQIAKTLAWSKSKVARRLEKTHEKLRAHMTSSIVMNDE